MAIPKHGKTGAFYASIGILRANTISFAISPSRILDSGNGFVTGRFAAGMKVTVLGSASNDTTYTIDTGGVAAGALTLTGAPTPEAAGPMVTVYQAGPGGAPYGFTNWTLDWTADAPDVTNFQSSGAREFINGIYQWKGTGERNFSLEDAAWTTNIWVGGVVNTWQWVRFFVQYAAIPTTTPGQAIYYEGLALVTATNVTWPHDGIVTQKYDIQGAGALTPVIKTTAW